MAKMPELELKVDFDVSELREVIRAIVAEEVDKRLADLHSQESQGLDEELTHVGCQATLPLTDGSALPCLYSFGHSGGHRFSMEFDR